MLLNQPQNQYRHARSINLQNLTHTTAEIYDGGSRSAAARIGGVGLQIVRKRWLGTAVFVRG
jgi:hypothetical protein